MGSRAPPRRSSARAARPTRRPRCSTARCSGRDTRRGPSPDPYRICRDRALRFALLGAFGTVLPLDRGRMPGSLLHEREFVKDRMGGARRLRDRKKAALVALTCVTAAVVAPLSAVAQINPPPVNVPPVNTPPVNVPQVNVPQVNVP